MAVSFVTYPRESYLPSSLKGDPEAELSTTYVDPPTSTATHQLPNFAPSQD